MLVTVEYCPCGTELYVGNPDGSAESVGNTNTMINVDDYRRLNQRSKVWMHYVLGWIMLAVAT